MKKHRFSNVYIAFYTLSYGTCVFTCKIPDFVQKIEKCDFWPFYKVFIRLFLLFPISNIWNLSFWHFLPVLRAPKLVLPYRNPIQSFQLTLRPPKSSYFTVIRWISTPLVKASYFFTKITQKNPNKRLINNRFKPLVKASHFYKNHPKTPYFTVIRCQWISDTPSKSVLLFHKNHPKNSKKTLINAL